MRLTVDIRTSYLGVFPLFLLTSSHCTKSLHIFGVTGWASRILIDLGVRNTYNDTLMTLTLSSEHKRAAVESECLRRVYWLIQMMDYTTAIMSEKLSPPTAPRLFNMPPLVRGRLRDGIAPS